MLAKFARRMQQFFGALLGSLIGLTETLLDSIMVAVLIGDILICVALLILGPAVILLRLFPQA